MDPDPIFVGVVLSYAAEHPRTFGGVWVDRNAGGTVVMAFTDDPEPHRAALAARRPSPDDEVAVEPRPPIVDDRPIGQWDQTFDVLQVPYSETDIVATHEELVGQLPSSPIEGLDIAFDPRRNRLAIWGVDPTDERIVQAASKLTDRVCVAERSPFEQDIRFQPGDPIDVIPDRGSDGLLPADTLVSCGAEPFPASALENLMPLVDSNLPGVERALAKFLATDEGQYWPQDGWSVLTSDRDVLLMHAGADEISFMRFTPTGSGWRWDTASSNTTCALRTVMPEGLGQVDWRLNRAFPRPGPDSTEIHLRVTERDCASGQPLGDRLLGPQIVETDQSVLVAFAAIAQYGNVDCQENPSTPVIVTLPSTLADRDLRDGTVVIRDIRELLGG